jgi:glucose-1-phosphate cytidylyltransferase
VSIGYRPIVWHLMRYYAHFGHKDFILCLGYRGDLIREYFLTYREELTNDFVLQPESGKVDLLSRDVSDWKITFVETGLHSNIGQRLMRVRRFVENEPMFLANYADGLSDMPPDNVISLVERQNAIAGFASVRSSQSFHVVRASADGIVSGISAMNRGDLWMNGGFFALRPEIFDHMNEGEELVEKPFARLLEKQRLVTYQHHGFWQAMSLVTRSATIGWKRRATAVDAGGSSRRVRWREQVRRRVSTVGTIRAWC